MRPDLTTYDLPILKGKELWSISEVTGDKRADVFTWYDEYLDLATGKSTKLVMPPGAPSIKLEECIVSPDGAVGDFLSKGSKQIAFYYGPRYHTTSFVIFDAKGSCLSYEEIGESCYEILNWRLGGRDHLTLCTESRVLIYP